MTPEPTTEVQADLDADAVRSDWLARLGDLITLVETWSGRAGWRTRRITKAMKDSVLGPYRAPALLMQRETVEVILDPVARFVPGAEGAVDLYLMPAYDDIASLYLMSGNWTLYYVFRSTPAVVGVPEPEAMSLTEETVIKVLDAISDHVA